MKHLHFWLIILIYFSSFAANYTDITPVGLPQSSQTGMCFLNIDNDDDLEFVYSYIENKRQVTRIYQTQNGNIRTDLFFEVEGKFLTNLQTVAFTPNGAIQFLAVEPFENGNQKFSLFEIQLDDKNNVIGLEEIATSFSSIFFKKITYDIFDFDNDGDLDIFFIGEGQPTVTEVLLNQGNYIFKNIPFQTAEYTQATITHYDFTGDGFQDVYLAGIVGNDTLGKLFKNVDGKFLEPFKEKELNVPAVVNGQVIIQRFNNNSFPDIYIRGERNKTRYSAIYEIEADKIVEINDSLPYFTNGFTQIHDFNNDGFYDILLSGFFPIENKNKTQIAYQNDKGKLILENLTPLSFSNSAVADINQDGNLEIVITGLFFDEKLNESLPKTFVYNNDFTANTIPFFSDTLNDLKINTKDNSILLNWKPAKDTKTSSNNLFYEVHVWNEKNEKIFGNSSKGNGKRFYPSKGMVQDTFMILTNVPKGKYKISVQAIDNGLLASKITVPKVREITSELPEELFNTFEIVQFRGENFENKFEIVDLDADGLKDFLLIDKDKKLTFLEQKEINVFQKSKIFEKYIQTNTHFEIGDYSLDGFVDVWFLNGDTTENELVIYNPMDSTFHETGILNLESFVLSDIDNDLDLDIIADSRTQKGTVLYENIDGEFELVIFSFNEFLRPVGVYDFDKDSYLDFYFITDTIVNNNKLQNAYLGINNYTKSLGKKGSEPLFLRKKILANENFKVIDGLDAGTDGDWDLLIETPDDYAVLENQGGGKWVVSPLPFTNQFDRNKTQVRVADFNGDFKKEAWRFSIDTLEIFFPESKKAIKYASNIYKKDENWGNTDSQKALQWIKIVDLNADGWNDLLAHVIINNKPQTYYFPNFSDTLTPNINPPTNLKAQPTVGRATLNWSWSPNTTNNSQAEYLLEMQKITSSGKETTIELLNFDAVHTSNNKINTQTDKINYLGNTKYLQMNDLLEGDYIWRIISKIDNHFSEWSKWDTLHIHNFLQDTIPPIHDTSNRNQKGTNHFSKSADFDNDGDLDFLFIGNKEEKTALNYLYINTNGKFDTLFIDLPLYAYADVKIIDYNKDDFPDLMISGIDATWTTPSSAIFVNNQNNTFTKMVDFPAVAFGSMDQSDIDNDGDWDYVLTGKTKTGIYENYIIEDTSSAFSTNPTFKFYPFTIDKNPKNKIQARFIDSNNDGLIDLFCSVYNTTESYIFTQSIDSLKNNPSIIITNKAIKENTGSFEFFYTSFGDYDNDGYLDLISIGITPTISVSNSDFFANEKAYFKDSYLATNEKKNTWTLKLYQNTKGTWVSQNELPNIPLGQNRIENIQWWDIDNDGDLDFFIQQAEHIVIVEMNDNENFEASSQIRINGDFSYSTFGDFNKDSRLDFVTGGLTQTYYFQKNNVSYENYTSFIPKTSLVRDPIDESTDEIFNGTSATIEWEESSENPNLPFGTEDISIQYIVNVSHEKRGILVKNYQTHNPFVTLQNLEDGKYIYQIQSLDQGGVLSDSSMNGNFEIRMKPEIIGKQKICQNDTNTFTIEPINQEYTWFIVKENKTDTIQTLKTRRSIQISLDTNNHFVQKIIVQNKNYPTKLDTLPLFVFKNPIADFMVGENISIGAIVPFTNTSSENVNKFQWNIDKSEYSEKNIEHTFFEAGRHNVRLNVENEIGCKAQKEIDVNVSNNVIINTSAFITQNDDDKNDFLYIQYLERYSTNKLHIYNQWGQQVYEIENYHNDWKDKLGDTKLPIGNYFLIIEVFIQDKEKNHKETQTFKSTFSVLK